jgi:hypothetical protein
MRSLVLHHEGAPLLVASTAGPIKQRIGEYPPDDVELFRVWSVPTNDDSVMPAFDITEQFAKTWALECAFGPGTEPHEYLAPIPAFVREHAGAELIRIWQRRRAETDADFMPAVLAGARVAA